MFHRSPQVLLPTGLEVSRLWGFYCELQRCNSEPGVFPNPCTGLLGRMICIFGEALPRLRFRYYCQKI